MDEETDFLSSHRCSMVKRYNMPTFFTPDKTAGTGRLAYYQQSSPTGGEMEDTLNVMQPNNVFLNNETIIEETSEADESQIQ